MLSFRLCIKLDRKSFAKDVDVLNGTYFVSGPNMNKCCFSICIAWSCCGTVCGLFRGIPPAVLFLSVVLLCFFTFDIGLPVCPPFAGVHPACSLHGDTPFERLLFSALSQMHDRDGQQILRGLLLFLLSQIQINSL